MAACRLCDFLWVGMHGRNARQHISRCSASMLRKPDREALELFIFVLYLVKYRENQFILSGVPAESVLSNVILSIAAATQAQ